MRQFLPVTQLAAFAILAISTSVCVFGQEKSVSVSSIQPSDLVEYNTMKPAVQKLVKEALKLTNMKLGYIYGSNTPKNRGMDCSGSVQYTLNQAGISGVPRSSYTIYHWAKKNSSLVATKQPQTLNDAVFDKLNPGDLLFWEGTYSTADRDPPISHVMIYLGTYKKDGKPVIFGASSGRRFRGKKIHGVSVFDFSLPRPDSKAKFVAYGPIPGLKK